MPRDLSRETRSQHQQAPNGVNIILTSTISTASQMLSSTLPARSISGDGRKLQKVDSGKENLVANAFRRTKDTTDGLDCTEHGYQSSVIVREHMGMNVSLEEGRLCRSVVACLSHVLNRHGKVCRSKSSSGQ